MAEDPKPPEEELVSPVEDLDTRSVHRRVEEGIGLCLSGGGYRAMLFHLGALWRLNEFGYLPKIDRISSVSGGSITAGVLGLKWADLSFDAQGVARKFSAEVVQPVRELAGETIDRGAILKGTFWFGTIAEKLVGKYNKYLFDKKTLQALPDRPRFVINASNVQSGALWRFMKPYIRDYRVGEIKADKQTVELAVAVAASSAFPPVLSPLTLKFKETVYTPNSGMDLQYPPYTTKVVLTDGGVYDNLGLETVWKRYKTVLVSNGGGKMQPEPKPKKDWLQHTYRVLNVIDNQVRSLRARQVIGSYKLSAANPLHRDGAYWGIRSDISNYRLPDALPCPFNKTIDLANTSTRLAKLESELQEKLINWGYAVCDAAMRKHVDPALPAPKDFPYPNAKV